MCQGPFLAIFAHPDDEFAVFPWLRRAVLDSRQIQLVWLTDGGWGGQDILRRQAESRRVLASMGVDPAAMCFWGAKRAIPDGDLYRCLHATMPELLQCFGTPGACGEVLMPAWEGGHHDHDASHLAGIQIAQARGARMSQYSLYHGEGLAGPWFKVLSPLLANGEIEVLPTDLRERLHYAALCLRYRSQWKSFLGLLPFYLLRMLRSRAFVRQPVDPRRTAQRPHDGLMLYERRSGPQWAEFAAATAAFRSGTSHSDEDGAKA